MDTSLSRDVFNFTFTTIDGNSTFKELENVIATFPTNLSASARDKAQELDEKATGIWNVATRLKRSLPGENDDEGGDGGSKTWDKRNELRDVLVMVRIFAFLVLDCANECGNSAAHLQAGNGRGEEKEKGEKSRGNLLRLMKVGIKTGRDCLSMCACLLLSSGKRPGLCEILLILRCGIDGQKIDYAVKVLEKLAGYTIYSEELLHTYESAGKWEDKVTFARFTAEYFILRTLLVR